MTPRTVVLTITVGSPQMGLWCDGCALPSVVRFPLLLITDHGVSTVGTYDACGDCGSQQGHVREQR